MQRVWVVGNSGSGKTTLAQTLARRLGAEHIELDAINHQPGWQPMGPEAFRSTVAGRLASPTWVVDGNYSAVADLVLARADTVIWLDLPRAKIMRQLAARTVRRGLFREELWNGNRESLRGMLSRDPEKSIMLWAWRNHAEYAERYERLAARTELTMVRLRSRAETDAYLAGIVGGLGTAAT